MRFTTFATYCLSFVTFASCSVPTYIETEADLVERDFSVPSLVANLLDGFDVADAISDIDFEKIAGWADDLLNKDNNTQYLDKVLVGLKNTQILPEAAVYIVTHNTTLNVLKKALPTVLKVAGNVNATSLFVALDRSGLAYSVVAGALTDDELLPAVLSIAKKLIANGGIDLQSLLDQAGQLVTRDMEDFESGVESFDVVPLERRDNIEDLLTTVFSSVERSGLVTDTVNTLLTNDEFQDAAVVLIQGALQNIGSIIKGTNFSALKPFLNSLKESGLLSHTLERALDDADLRTALTSDLASLLKKGTIKQSDLVEQKQVSSILSMDATMDFSSVSDEASETGEVSSAEESSTSASSASSAAASETEAEDAGSQFEVNTLLLVIGAFVPVGLMML